MKKRNISQPTIILQQFNSCLSNVTVTSGKKKNDRKATRKSRKKMTLKSVGLTAVLFLFEYEAIQINYFLMRKMFASIYWANKNFRMFIFAGFWNWNLKLFFFLSLVFLSFHFSPFSHQWCTGAHRTLTKCNHFIQKFTRKAIFTELYNTIIIRSNI